MLVQDNTLPISSIHVTTMPNRYDINDSKFIVHRIDGSPVSDPNAPFILASLELYATRGTGIVDQLLQR